MRGFFLIFLIVVILSGCGDSEEGSNVDPATEENNDGKLSLKIGAFNADILGKTKMGKNDIANYIADIIAEFDIILIQEIRDVSLETPEDLLTLVNAKNKGTYTTAVSTRLGRTSSKEQYVFYYKSDGGLKVSGESTYEDSGDVFEREPYSVLFTKSDFSFVLIGIHIKPSDAINELNTLDEVYESVKSTHFANDWIILGDLNADCSYVSDSEYEALDLVTKGFRWGLSKNADTTVSDTDCSYDNVVFNSSNISEVSIYNFQEKFSINQEKAKDISNHFPVSFTLSSP